VIGYVYFVDVGGSEGERERGDGGNGRRRYLLVGVGLPESFSDANGDTNDSARYLVVGASD